MKILETFAGIGSQIQALKHDAINAKIQASYISEWYIDAIIAYKAINYPNSKNIHKPTIDEMLEQFNRLILSKDSKAPHKFTRSEIKSNIEKYSNLYNANLITNNYGSVSNVHNWLMEDLNNIDLLTYSFPCQDLSTAGNMLGLEEGAGTRSSLLWNIRDLIDRIHNKFDKNEMPKVLLMENVSVIESKRYSKGLDTFEDHLKNYGYTSIRIHLNAKDYGLPQNRKRFFLISIRNDQYKNLFKYGSEDKIPSNLRNTIVMYDIEKMFTENIREILPKINLRHILRNFDNLPISTRNKIYEKQLQNMFNEGLISNSSKVQNADHAYPTFNQAKVVVGIGYTESPTVTFQGEFSRIRFFKIKNGIVCVRRANSKVNWELMGLSTRNYNLLLKNNLRENTISSLSGNSITINQLLAIFNWLKRKGVWN